MNPASRASTRHRLAGLALAAVGVVLARFAAPAFAPGARSLVALLGAMIAGSGLFVIALGIRRRLRLETSATGSSADAPAAAQPSPPV